MKGILVFIIFNLIIASSAFSKSSDKSYFPNLDYKDMNVHHILMLRKELVKFQIELEKTNPNSSNEQVNIWEKINKIMLTEAFAATGDSCFFAGWPSEMIGKTCKGPWTHGNENWAAGLKCKGESDTVSCTKYINTSYKSCGNKNQFRCSPLLFGTGTAGEQGKCIKTGGTYYGLTAKCDADKELQSNVGSHAKFLKQNPMILKKIEKETETFCKNNEDKNRPNYDHTKTCDALKSRLLRLQNIIAEDKILTQEEANQAQEPLKNKALGILDKCQNEYDKNFDKREDEFSATHAVRGFFRSRRGSLARIQNSASCPNEEPAIGAEEFQTLFDSIDDISDKVIPRKMLEESVKDGLELTIKNYLITMTQFGKKVPDFKLNILFNEEYKHLGKGVFNKVIEKAKKEVADRNLKPFKIDGDKGVLKEFNKFGEQFNTQCKLIRSKYRERVNSGTIIEDTVTNSESENKFYATQQIVLNKNYHNFRTQDKQLKSRIFTTDHFQSSVFPFNGNIAEKCAEGDLSSSEGFLSKPDAFMTINKDDIDESVVDYEKTMLKDLENLNKMAKALKKNTPEGIQNSIQELLQYKPFLLGQFLKEQGSDPETQQAYAKYLCKESLGVYDSDEYYRIGEVSVGLLAAAGSAIASSTLVGAPVAIALTAVSASLIAGEGALAVHAYNDAANTLDGANLALSSEKHKMSVKDFAKISAKAEDKKTEAYVSGAAAMIGPAIGAAKLGHIGYKTIKGGKVAVDGTDLAVIVAKTTNTTAKISDQASKSAKNSNILLKSSKNTGDVAKKASSQKPGTSLQLYKTTSASKKGTDLTKAKDVKKSTDIAKAKNVKKPVDAKKTESAKKAADAKKTESAKKAAEPKKTESNKKTANAKKASEKTKIPLTETAQEAAAARKLASKSGNVADEVIAYNKTLDEIAEAKETHKFADLIRGAAYQSNKDYPTPKNLESLKKADAILKEKARALVVSKQNLPKLSFQAAKKQLKILELPSTVLKKMNSFNKMDLGYSLSLLKKIVGGENTVDIINNAKNLQKNLHPDHMIKGNYPESFSSELDKLKKLLKRAKKNLK